MEQKNPILTALGSSDVPSSTEVTPEEKHMLTRAACLIEPDVDAGRKITRELLINRLNFINFVEGNIQIHFTHRQYSRSTFITAVPQPCFGPEIECSWPQNSELKLLLRTYELKYILVPRGEKFIKAFPEVIKIDGNGCWLRLPEISYEMSHRKVERQRCSGITIHLIQNSSSFSGTLLDFSAPSFKIEINAEPPANFEWIDTSKPVHIIFNSGNRVLFSGECCIIRSTSGRSVRNYVLEPVNNQMQRFRKAEFRSERQALRPSPYFIYSHPLTNKRCILDVIDLSGSGFSVEEEERSASLIPGLIIPNAELNFAGLFKMTCTVQVVFRKLADPETRSGRVLCGLALIDVAAKDHVKLLGLLQQLKNKNTYVCNDLDLNALWDFFFETGFIYPSKYALLANRKNEIKDTYERLYTRCPDIARHFVCQKNGVVLGHMATIRFWDNAWLIHHHAARKSALNKAGLTVLGQIGSFGHDSFRIRGMHMDYLVCYYRPENRFPHRIFGGVARHINNSKGCSLDLFAFLKRSELQNETILPRGWELTHANENDLENFADFYEESSGGLMAKALDLEAVSYKEEELCSEFKFHGFRRERHIFALKKSDTLKALLIVNISDIGLNLSDLTHCIKAVITDPEDLSPDILFSSFCLAEKASGQSCLPALISPVSYAEKNAVHFDKAYNLWVFHMHTQSQTYFKYVNRLLKYA